MASLSFPNSLLQLSVTPSQKEEGEQNATHGLPQQATNDPPLPATSNGKLGHPQEFFLYYSGGKKIVQLLKGFKEY